MSGQTFTLDIVAKEASKHARQNLEIGLSRSPNFYQHRLFRAVGIPNVAEFARIRDSAKLALE